MLNINKVSLVVVLFMQSFSSSAADWNYNKPLYDPSGHVQIKTLAGVSKSLTNTSQLGLGSSASPTVLNVQIGNQLSIKKFVEFTVDLNPTSNTVNRTLPEAFDISKSLIDMSMMRVGTVCYWPSYPYNACELIFSGVTHSVDFTSDTAIRFTAGDRYGSQRIADSRYNVKVIELASGSVVRGAVNLNPCSVIEVVGAQIKQDTPLFTAVANGGTYFWPSHPYNAPEAAAAIGVTTRAMDGKLVFEAGCGHGSVVRVARVFYQYVI